MKELNFNNHSVLIQKKSGRAMKNIHFNPFISLSGQRSWVESLTRLALAGLIVLFSFAAGAQTTYYVDTNVSGGAGDGASWADAYTDLQDALGVSTSGDSIFVAAGTYKPTTGAFRSATFNILGGVSVYGGFAGDEANLAARDLSAGNETILSGDLGTAIGTLGDFDDGGYDDNTYHVVSMLNADALLDGFTVQGGNANGSFPNNVGGGIYANAAGILRNLIVRYNNSEFGGGMYLRNLSIGTLTAVNCTVYGNRSNVHGGGIMLENQSSGTLTVTNATVYDNEASHAGGGMFLVNESTGTLTVTNATVYDNEATSNFSNGGGMYLGNQSTGTLTAANCTVYNNEASSSGGGMFLVNESTGTLTVANATVYDNEANLLGGGMFLRNESTGTLTVANSINFGNTATSEGPDVYLSTFGTETTLSNCLLGEAAGGGTLTITNPIGTDDGSGNVLGDPLFASTNRNHFDFLRLMAVSPALDAGDNDLVPTGVTTDLAGNARIQDGKNDNTATVDLGAYERGVPLPTIYVNANASGGNDGSSWAKVYTNLQEALIISTPGDSIFVAAGTYTPSTAGLTDPRLATFIIPAGVLVYGGFAGDEANLAARDLSAGHETILSGDLGFAITTLGNFDDGGYDDNTYHVVSMLNADALLDGFTVQGGNANGSFPNNVGGGIYANAAGILRNLIVRYNDSDFGGGMYLRNQSTGTLTAVNCTVYDNEANFGGGMLLDNESTGPLTAVNCTAYGNNANTSGGGMYLENRSTGTLTVANTTFYDNEANFGGGMYLDNESTGPLTVTNSISFGNIAPNGPDVRHLTDNNATTLANCLLGEAATGEPLTITNAVGTDDGNGNVLGDPLFASRNPNKAVFLRLTAASPALDAGDNSRVPAGVTTDLAGNARIQNTTVDVGAYEGLFVAPPASIYYVDVNVNGGSGDGSSWANAYTDLQDALRQTERGDSIFVAAGIYVPTTGTSRAATFSIPGGTSVYGGFAGGEANLAARDLSAGHETILSGDLGFAITTLGNFDDTGYDDNSYHVVRMLNANALLDGFTVQGGNADGSFPDTRGGGIYVTGANTLRNLTVRYNTSSFLGGGMFLRNQSTGPITAVNCTVHDNKADFGGGMYLRNRSSGPLTTVNCTVYANEATNSGGGMYLWNTFSGKITATNCTSYDNEAANGGGMALVNTSSGDITATNCTIYDNQATNGGGMALESISSGNVTAANCISYGNTASGEGADAYNFSTNLNTLVSHCLLGTAVAGNATAGTDYTLTAAVTGDPLFVSTTAGDAEFLRLLKNSPAIDAGDNNLVPTDVTTDLAGNARIQDGNGDNTATVDLGAYERLHDLVLATPAPSVDENASHGEEVSTLNVTDTSLGIVSFAVSENGAKSGNFEVVDDNGTWKLQVATGANLDYEALSGTTPAYTIELTIQGKDANDNEVGNALDVTITINDVNEAATGIDLNTSAVAENSNENTEIGTLSATGDPESFDSHTFSFDSSNPVQDSEGTTLASGLFKIAGDKLQRGAELLDYEVLPEPEGFTAGDAKEITLRLTATDDGTPAATSEVLEVTVEVSDVNEMPAVPTLLTSGSGATYTDNTVEITEVAAAGDALLTAESTDPEGNNVTYRLDAASSTAQVDLDALITMDETTGIITLAKALTIADNASHTFKVIASDGDLDAETEEQTLTINIVPPLGLSDAGGYAIYPNPVSGDEVLQISGFAGDRVEILDLSGRVLTDRTLRGAIDELPVANLPAGTYLVRISPANGDGTKSTVLRFIRE